MAMRRGLYFGVDGGEGTGTTTMTKYLVEQMKGGKALWTREPGGANSPYAEEIRRLILSDSGKQADAETMFCLFWAARRDHLVNTVWPALKDGITVISDRGDSSTWAYQIYGQEQTQLEDLFSKMRLHYFGQYTPDHYFILDARPEVGLARTKKRADKPTHFDERDLKFHSRVRRGFLEFASWLGGTIINAEHPQQEVEARLLYECKRWVIY